MIKFPLLRGAVRHCKLIGEDETYRALRERNEMRLAALKASGQLYEKKDESATARSRAEYLSARNTSWLERAGYFQCHADLQSERPYNSGAGIGYEAGSALATIFRGTGNWP
jgi:hypothetical protein